MYSRNWLKHSNPCDPALQITTVGHQFEEKTDGWAEIKRDLSYSM